MFWYNSKSQHRLIEKIIQNPRYCIHISYKQPRRHTHTSNTNVDICRILPFLSGLNGFPYSHRSPSYVSCVNNRTRKSTINIIRMDGYLTLQIRNVTYI